MAGSASKKGVKKIQKKLEGVLKAVVKEGGGDSIQEGSQVVYHCTIKNSDGEIRHSTRRELGGSGRPRRVVLGKSPMLLAIEQGLCTMRAGEISVFKVKPVSHFKDPSCPLPCPANISPDEELQFEVEVLRADVIKHLLPEVKTPKADDEVPEEVNEASEEEKKEENQDPWAFDNKLLTKLGLEEGEGWEKPRPPSEVLCRVVARPLLSSTPFFSSGETPMYIRMGTTVLPSALLHGLSHMSAGERAVIFASKDHLRPVTLLDSAHAGAGGAVGGGGSGDALSGESVVPSPPSGVEDVEYEVQLDRIIQVRDVMGDGSVIKRRLKDGEGEFPVDCPLQDCVVHFHVRGTLPDHDDQVFMDTRKDDSPLAVGTGEGMLPEGLETSIRLMLPKEVARITCRPRLAYDSFPRPTGVPEGATVEWEVELLSFNKPRSWEDLTFAEIMEEVQAAKKLGNQLFKDAKFSHAAVKYEKVVKELRNVHPDGKEEASELLAAQTALQLNIAACQHALGEYVRAIEWADKVLGDQPNHAKALYRRGMAHIFTGDFEDAQADFQRMVASDPATKPDAAVALAKLKRKEEEAKAKDRQAFGGLFNRKPGLLSDDVEEIVRDDKLEEALKQRETARDDGSPPQVEDASYKSSFIMKYGPTILLIFLIFAFVLLALDLAYPNRIDLEK